MIVAFPAEMEGNALCGDGNAGDKGMWESAKRGAFLCLFLVWCLFSGRSQEKCGFGRLAEGWDVLAQQDAISIVSTLEHEARR